MNNWEQQCLCFLINQPDETILEALIKSVIIIWEYQGETSLDDTMSLTLIPTFYICLSQVASENVIGALHVKRNNVKGDAVYIARCKSRVHANRKLMMKTFT